MNNLLKAVTEAHEKFKETELGCDFLIKDINDSLAKAKVPPFKIRGTAFHWGGYGDSDRNYILCNGERVDLANLPIKEHFCKLSESAAMEENGIIFYGREQ